MVLAVLLFFGLWSVAQAQPVRPGSARAVVVTIPRGAGTVAIGRILARHGLIRSPYLFTAIAKLSGHGGRLEAGEYELTPGMTLSQIIRHLESGDVVVVHVTVPPGFDVDQIIARLVRAHLGSRAAFTAACRDWGLVAGLAARRAGVRWAVEGFLYPDTYSFTHAMSPQAIIAAMVHRFRQVWTPAMTAAAGREKLSVDQAVTLASIVEREAKVERERPIIAGVYMNRLHRRMHLDADPTVLYALGLRTGVLTEADLQLNSPYNTYARLGLPPGPIASPGLASIQAALHPAHVPYLYFVAKGDGTHAFSDTLAEQLANRRKYLGH